MIIKLSSTDAAAVFDDIETIIPGWKASSRRSPLRGISFVNLGDRELQGALVTENGDVIFPPVLAGETRYDIIVPDDFEIPDLLTRVFPEISDHQLY